MWRASAAPTATGPVRPLRPWRVLQGVAAATILYTITVLGPQGVAPFIYFRF